jgi:beta-aspartyl-peptidase (threonine type)
MPPNADSVTRLRNESTDVAVPARWALAIHGGAGTEAGRLSFAQRSEYEVSLQAALGVGEHVLRGGGTALDAVESTLRQLEDDPIFNAGRGAACNYQGRHELDASLMDGRTRQAGAVAGVLTVKNPISLARLVMMHTSHVLLAGEGAEHFADEMRSQPQIERVSNNYFTTELRLAQWQQALREPRNGFGDSAQEESNGTVGCVALDRYGDLAAGTSTGGITHKRWGRIGDSPIIGAGTYADNATCAVSCTGMGEHFLRTSAAFHVAALKQYRHLPLAEAVQYLVDTVLEPNTGGIIALDRAGNVAMGFNTLGMARAAIDGQGRREIGLGRSPAADHPHVEP